MEKLAAILNPLDLHYLVTVSLILVIFYVFYYMAEQKQKNLMLKVDEAFKRQGETNRELHLVVAELRRANRFLAELVGIESIGSAGEGSDLELQSSSPVESLQDSQNKLYVGNIDYTATESELASYFAQYGQVEFVNIPVNRYTGKARGFGFVTFASKEGAEQAMALHGTEFRGRQIQVNFAKERELA